jgi:hypothetical protein
MAPKEYTRMAQSPPVTRVISQMETHQNSNPIAIESRNILAKKVSSAGYVNL